MEWGAGGVETSKKGLGTIYNTRYPFHRDNVEKPARVPKSHGKPSRRWPPFSWPFATHGDGEGLVILVEGSHDNPIVLGIVNSEGTDPPTTPTRARPASEELSRAASHMMQRCTSGRTLPKTHAIKRPWRSQREHAPSPSTVYGTIHLRRSYGSWT